MRCGKCGVDLPDAARFCLSCGTAVPQVLACQACGSELPPEARFCLACGTAVGAADKDQPSAGPAPMGYCHGSGTAIYPGDPHFKCLQCGKLYVEAHRFEDQPICKTCAYESGMAQKLEVWRAKQAEQEAERRSREEESRRQAEAEARAKAEAAEWERERERERQREAEEKRQAEESAREQSELLSRLGVSEASWAPIPAGDYLMGSPESEAERISDEGQHRVQVSAFDMQKTPVTFAMFDVYCEATGKDKPKDQGWGRGDRPVINVTYWDAVDYAEWLSQQTGWNCRLPTEAQWEYACRAGTQTPFWTGQTITPEQANYNGNVPYGGGAKGVYRGRTTPVDLFRANSWGLHDMHGNVWEWCASEYDEGYTGLEQRDASRDRGNGNRRVLRGGSWIDRALFLRAARRSWLDPGSSFLSGGFRLARI